MRSQRMEQMEAYILEHKTVTLDELCEEFGVSKNTVRRDLDVLLENRRFKKIYGGVTVEDFKELVSFGEHFQAVGKAAHRPESRLSGRGRGCDFH